MAVSTAASAKVPVNPKKETGKPIMAVMRKETHPYIQHNSIPPLMREKMVLFLCFIKPAPP
jgi:hypothetical protein